MWVYNLLLLFNNISFALFQISSYNYTSFLLTAKYNSIAHGVFNHFPIDDILIFRKIDLFILIAYSDFLLVLIKNPEFLASTRKITVITQNDSSV